MTDAQTWTLPVRRLPSRRTEDAGSSPLAGAWQRSMCIYEQTLFGPVASIDYCANGRLLGVAAANHLLALRLPMSQGSALFSEQAPRSCFSLKFRPDGRTALQCIEQRIVLRSLDTPFERSFVGHTRDVRGAVFLTNHLFASVSDDKTVRLWDFVQHTQVNMSGAEDGSGHRDYVRSVVRLTEHTFATGSYDRSAACWDARVGLASPTLRWQVDAPVEDICQMHACQVVVASGDVVRLFDTRGGRHDGAPAAPLHEASFHTKTVTTVASLPVSDASPFAGDMFVTGGLDQRLRVVDAASFQVVASKKYDAAVTAIALHPTGKQFSVGFVTGKFQVHSLLASRAEEDAEDEQEATAADRKEAALKVQAQAAVTDEDLTRPAHLHDGLEGRRRRRDGEALLTSADRADDARRKALLRIRGQLANFQYQRALRTALYTQTPEAIWTTVDELQRRCVMRVALSGQHDRTIAQVLRFIVHFIDNPLFSSQCITLLNIVVDIYGPIAPRSEFFHRELMRVYRRLGELVSCLETTRRTGVIVDHILASS